MLRGLVALTISLSACHAPEPGTDSTDRRKKVVLAATPDYQALPESAPALVPGQPPALVSDLVFEGPALLTCDEFRGPGALSYKPAQLPPNEVWREGQDCATASGGKPWQGRCTRPQAADGTSLTTYHYDVQTLSGTDAALRECLQVGGTYSKGDDRSARREAAEQRLRQARGLLGPLP